MDKNILETGGNASYYYPLLFPQCFNRHFLQVVQKSRCAVKSLELKQGVTLDSNLHQI